jgi:hypothetical protein
VTSTRTFSCTRARAHLGSRGCNHTVAGTRLHATQHPAPRTTSAPSTPQSRQLRRTCSTGRRSTRTRWRRSGSKDHQPHLQCCCQRRRTFSCTRARAHLDSRACVYTVAGTRPHAKQHPANPKTCEPLTPQSRQPRRTCSTGRRTTRTRWRRI